MSNETMNQITEQFAKAFEPARAFAGLTVDHVEKLAQIQLEAARAHTELGFAQLRDALQVADAKSLQDYAAKQKDVAETVTRQVRADAEKIGELGQGFTAEAARIAEHNVAKAQAAAKPARRKAAPRGRSSGPAA